MKKFLIIFVVLFGFVQFSVLGISEKTFRSESQKAIKLAIDTLESIASRDYQKLAEYIHPEMGVIFVPYSYIDYEENLIFTCEQLKEVDVEKIRYTWGFYDQSPKKIELTFNEYIEQFVYDKDYLNVKQITIDATFREGNSVENVNEFFDGCIFVDFYDDGTVAYEGLDWSSLRIVTMKYENEFKVVAFIHSSYTL